MSQPWKTDQWFTSPWNYIPEVREKLNFPESIRFHDVTLRDGARGRFLERGFLLDFRALFLEGLPQPG